MQHSVKENESSQLPKVFTEVQEARVREIIQEEIQKAKVEDLDAVNEE
ncbi:hypothetical protein [Pseudomonas sp. GM84]|nr:hypothetical protein [Pseudomonas sp. GM84]